MKKNSCWKWCNHFAGKHVAEDFRSYFGGIVDGLNIKHCKISKKTQWSDRCDQNFKNIPAFLKKELNSDCRFSFKNVSLENVKKVTQKLDISKPSHLEDISIKTIKQNADIFSGFLFANNNLLINIRTFPKQLK